MDNGGSGSLVPASLGDVWSAIGTFFSDALGPAIDVIASNALLVAPLVVFVASRVLGQAKSLFKIGGRRK